MAVGNEWSKRAACQGADPEIFFPLNVLAAEQVGRAKEICARCPVVRECHAFAQRTGQAEGIWGGMTPQERRMSRFPVGWRQSRRKSVTSAA
ncbi:WhiB family transcriptional regulator [Bailinhaonella thermotolerans]|uniref:Transcriptional regulator WhiB n=1 Tax=Bailinhaonella thermotolerans TaxID=1070861 RepID=A0A3A4ADG1_9ACTN|nr:WhiB family transcriptional regulator [Bailinhaonella thermotolerans]RJL23633.1 WhiB family transcriptional regulator [Bailinhaonella thermotolerans]